MLKQTITFDDLEGNPVTEDFYFHLNKAEALKAQAMFFGASAQRFEEALRKQDLLVPIKAVLDLFLMAYGEKSADGRAFIKNDTNREWFRNTNAYGELVESLATDTVKLEKFLIGVMPEGFMDSAKIQDKPSGTPANYQTPPPLPTPQI